MRLTKKRHSADHDWRQDGPFALVLPVSGGIRIQAVDSAAASEGIHPGMTLADARALLPGLLIATADPEGDARALAGLVDWCGCYTPFCARDGADGVILDISGCAHLFDGEDRLLSDLWTRLKRMGLTAKIAAASTPGAAWAWARYGGDGLALPENARKSLMPLSVSALRLVPEAVERLQQLGLYCIRDIIDLPRAPLARRCGIAVLDRLDRVFGKTSEPISPTRPTAEWRTRLAFVEPIGRAEDIALATQKLLEELCDILERHGRGARQLSLVLYRVDGTTQTIEIGTGQPNRNSEHLHRLFAEKLGDADPGFGIEVMILEATVTDSMSAYQLGVQDHRVDDNRRLRLLIDRLCNRLGSKDVFQVAPVASHIPERAVKVRPPVTGLSCDQWIMKQPRPIRLLATPEAIDAIAPLPNVAPACFTWRRRTHHVRNAEGPERIAPEWWRHNADRAYRDYYRIEDQDGRCFWVFRHGGYIEISDMRWYMHGFFA